MTEQIKRCVLCLAAAIFLGAAQAGAQKKQVYAFGVGGCLGDSVTYMTEIQQLDGVDFDRKTGFLVERGQYSRQMEAALASRYGKHFTCSFVFAATKAKAEKLFLSIRKNAQRGKNRRLESLPAADFRFSVPTTTEE